MWAKLNLLDRRTLSSVVDRFHFRSAFRTTRIRQHLIARNLRPLMIFVQQNHNYPVLEMRPRGLLFPDLFVSVIRRRNCL
jgi:hypothetical protein